MRKIRIQKSTASITGRSPKFMQHFDQYFSSLTTSVSQMIDHPSQLPTNQQQILRPQLRRLLIQEARHFTLQDLNPFFLEWRNQGPVRGDGGLDVLRGGGQFLTKPNFSI
jgi:hypothetical protein